MPRITANGIELDYAQHGDPDTGRPLVLMRGLGTQRIQWPDVFLDALVAGGHFVVTFDNRDVGRSQWFDEAGAPSIPDLLKAVAEGRQPEVAYDLHDMADDVVGLMDALGIANAHVAGISMGGMITTVVGYRHPDRVRSLVPIMASTGAPDLPPATPEAMAVLTTPAPTEREAYVAHQVRSAKVIGSPGFPTPEAELAEMAGRVFDRAFHPEGSLRQFVAVGATGDRSAQVATITAPTLVIHGTADPLVPVACGRDIADKVPGARWLEIEGMGHDVPVALCGRIADAISEHTREAERA
ncbi:MAG: alpha/beta fold hydrolase [Myxococcota bacterium]